jgi:hypothetical protein
MKEIATAQMSLINDRNVLKWRVNLVKGDRLFGFIRPV